MQHLLALLVASPALLINDPTFEGIIGTMEDVKEGKDYNFPAEEQEILRLWDEIDAFKEQLRRTEGKKKYTFYDGPPFATGLPHYGHLLAGTIKVSFLVCCHTLESSFDTALLC